MSNSEAMVTNSSSRAGSSRSRTAVTVAVTVSGTPAQSPLLGVNGKVRVSPALAPRTASSKPGSMPSVPIS